MKLVTAIVQAIVLALLSWFDSKLGQSAVDADSQVKTRQRLKQKIRKTWLPILAIIACVSGCSTRSIYVADGTPVRLRETIPNAKVWVMVKGQPTATTMDIPEGWYAVELSDNDD